tara:strand:+ start:246 stop:500 length:255 start_codon:yes stop_codon:yes gene_type:complete
MRTRIDNTLEELTFAKALLADGFEEALIGHTQGSNVVAVYEYDICINILMERDGMDVMEAIEYMDFNVLGSYVGEKTPIFVSLA